MIPEELMRQVRLLELRTRRAVTDVFSGEYQSAFRGRGMDFDEVREYQPGDEIRSIDWNVTARTGRPFVKRFVEERELTVVLAVDLSASGRFGTRQRLKNEAAAELCAVLAFAAASKNDKVGLLVFTDHVEMYVPPKKGRTHVLRLIREALNFEPSRGGTDIGGALTHLRRVLRKRAVVFLLSDFFDDGYERMLGVLARRHDVVALRIADPRERSLPRVGLIEFEDAESRRIITIDTGSRRVRREYEESARRREREVENTMRRAGIDYATVTTGEPYINTLLALFRRREKRR